MIESIYIAMSGLRGYELGLRLIANNTANLNTPGFKRSTLQFADAFYSGSGLAEQGPMLGQYGYGLTTLGTALDFEQGQLQTTGNTLDLAVDGLGMFVLQDADGHVYYTRDGQFSFDADGFLVSTSTGEKVLAFDDAGALVPVHIADLKASAAKPTATIVFGGNLSSTATTDTVANVIAIDRAGTSHTLSVKLDAVSGSPGTWNITLLEGTATVGTGQLVFVNGKPDPASAKVSITWTPAGQSDIPLTLDFSTNVTSYDSGSHSTLAFMSQDGAGPGDLTGTEFDDKGVLQLSYSNGQKVNGPRLALALFDSQDSVTAVGDNRFESADGRTWHTGVAGEDGLGAIRSGEVEASNVDLSQQFSDLVVMQRGYQACSQVISTANDMLTELFAVRSSR